MFKRCVLIFITALLFFLLSCCFACFRDLRTMKEYNLSLQKQMAQLEMDQAEQSKEMRLLKTNNDIMFELVINKDWKNE